jgi:hypothetical protein
LRAFELRNLLIIGEFGELRARARDALQRAEQTGDLYFITYHGVFIEPHLRLLADEPQAARRSIESALTRWSRGGYHIQHALAAEAIPAIGLYEGDAPSAVKALEEQWPLMQKHFLLRNLVFRRGVLELRARAAIGAASAAKDARERHLRAAERDLSDLNALEHLRQTCVVPAIQLLKSGAAETRGDRAQAIALATLAAEGFDERGLSGAAAAARWTLGAMVDGARGMDMRRTAEEWMRSQRIANPVRFSAMVVPGFTGLQARTGGLVSSDKTMAMHDMNVADQGSALS